MDTGNLVATPYILKTDKQQSEVPGALFIGLISFYELFIAFSNTMYGESSLLSKEFFFFLLFIFLISATNFADLIVKFFNKFSSCLLVLFLMYFLVSIILSTGKVKSEYLNQFIIYLPVSFLTGFIAFSSFKMKVKFGISQYTRKTIKSSAYILTFIYIALSLYILSGFLLTLDSRFIQIATETNIYYQDFGDAYIKASVCILIFQYLYLRYYTDYSKSYFKFSALVIFQTLLTAVNLVLIGSNKGTALVFLTSGFFILSAKPANWLFRGYYVKKRLFMILPIFFLGLGFLLYQLGQIDITKTRLFDYGDAGSISQNSSFTSRFDQFSGKGGDILYDNVIFGKLSIYYFHSTIASVQTHLGLIGSLLLWSFVILRLVSIYSKKGSVILKGIGLPILLIGAISSFFTWDLLWFYFGAISSDLKNTVNTT